MILPLDLLIVPQPRFRSGPVSDSSIWVNMIGSSTQANKCNLMFTSEVSSFSL
jgi:hypothetical protein